MATAVDEYGKQRAIEEPTTTRAVPSTEPQDPWKHRTQSMRCNTCLWYVSKSNGVGRCRRHSPTMSGYPVVFGDKDWCGDHKLSETKVTK
jgi:hypothetical protein